MRELIARLIDAVRAFAQAEIALVKATAAAWAGAAKVAGVFIAIALLLANAAIIVLLAAFGMTIAIWLGPAAGLAIAAVIGLVLAALFGWLAASRIMKMLK